MWSHNKPHPDHCHAYDCSIWRINPKLTCKYCVPLAEGEKPEKKIWCDDMDSCDSYNDGGIEKCKNCPAGRVVFTPIPTIDKSIDKVLKKLISSFDMWNCPPDPCHHNPDEVTCRKCVINYIKSFRKELRQKQDLP